MLRYCPNFLMSLLYRRRILRLIITFPKSSTNYFIHISAIPKYNISVYISARNINFCRNPHIFITSCRKSHNSDPYKRPNSHNYGTQTKASQSRSLHRVQISRSTPKFTLLATTFKLFSTEQLLQRHHLLEAARILVALNAIRCYLATKIQLLSDLAK